MNVPLVSVVMGVRDAENVLPTTLGSILTQTDCDFELVIIDDGSTDGTFPLLQQAADRDSRVRIWQQPRLGLTCALIAGCQAARGKFIVRHDAGDFSLPGRFAAQVTCLQVNPQVGFVSCRTEFVGPHGEFLWLAHGGESENGPTAILNLARENGVIAGPTHHGSVMFRAELYEAVGGYREEFLMGQDWDLWYRLAEKSHFITLPETFYRAGVGLNTLSSTRRSLQLRFAACSLAALRERAAGKSDQAALSQARNLRPVFQKSGSSNWIPGALFIGSMLARNGDFACREYFMRVIRARPWLIKAWIKWLLSFRRRKGS